MTKDEVIKIIRENQGVMLYFFSNACQPCVALRPKVKMMVSEKFPKLKLLLLESGTHPELSAAYHVFASPTIILFLDGKEYLRKSKYVSINELESEIGRLYQLAFDAED